MSVKRYAVATKHGVWIDEHFGLADRFQIYETDGRSVYLLEERPVTPFCNGNVECESVEEKMNQILEILKDCAGVVVLRIGIPPAKELYRAGILTYTLCEEILSAIQQIYNGRIAPYI